MVEMTQKRSCLAIILAGGEGTRMKSSLSKVLHKVAGLSLIGHILTTLKQISCHECAVITGYDSESVALEAKKHFPNAQIVVQNERLGTAHAVLMAKDLLHKNYDDILILFGDTPLIEKDILEKARQCLAKGTDIVVSGFYTENPSGYGRLLEKNGQLLAIIEEKEASEEQKEIKFCNGGFMAINGKILLKLLEQIDNNNAKKEFYLTDIVAIAQKEKLNVQAINVPFDNILGVNTRLELMEIEQIWQKRKRRELLLKGVTMQEASTVYFSYDTKIEADVILEPHIYFGIDVVIESGTHIRAFSYIEKTIIKKFSEIGPYARLRPGTKIEEGVKIGNFCEIKNTHIQAGAKVNHLSYIGDAYIDKDANIGAGTITCNYDGMSKWPTKIGKKAFIGSNVALVAPVTIADNAYIGSGSVITEDVPKNALALGRSRQINKENYNESLKQNIKLRSTKK